MAGALLANLLTSDVRQALLASARPLNFGSRPERDIAASMLDWLARDFEGTGVAFTLEMPAPGTPYATLYVGGDGSALGLPPSYWGLADGVDTGNREASDHAFIFSSVLPSEGLTGRQYGIELAEVVAHEAGHLIGFEHAFTMHSGPDTLADRAFRVDTHDEIALDIRRDPIDDGKVTIAGAEYDVNPRIVEAIRKYPRISMAVP
jgi:hypothetical protein